MISQQILDRIGQTARRSTIGIIKNGARAILRAPAPALRRVGLDPDDLPRSLATCRERIAFARGEVTADRHHWVDWNSIIATRQAAVAIRVLMRKEGRYGTSR